MGRPKGAKDKKPRKPRVDLNRRPRKPVNRGQCKEAPHGYGLDGQPLKCPAKVPTNRQGQMQLRKVLEEKGKLPPVLTGSKGKAAKALADREQIIRMAGIGCTIEEIANVVGVTQTVLQKEPWITLIQKHRDDYKASLRRQQLKLAMGAPARIEVVKDPEDGKVETHLVEPALAPSPQMAIHLGKVYLGQQDGTRVQFNQQNNFGAGPTHGTPQLTPENRDRLAQIFLRICPEAAQTAVILDPSMEVQVA